MVEAATSPDPTYCPLHGRGESLDESATGWYLWGLDAVLTLPAQAVRPNRGRKRHEREVPKAVPGAKLATRPYEIAPRAPESNQGKWPCTPRNHRLTGPSSGQKRHRQRGSSSTQPCSPQLVPGAHSLGFRGVLASAPKLREASHELHPSIWDNFSSGERKFTP